MVFIVPIIISTRTKRTVCVYCEPGSLSDENEEIFLASTSDNGDTFSEVTFNLSNNSEFSECPSIATSENNIYVIWQDSTPGNTEVFFTKAKI